MDSSRALNSWILRFRPGHHAPSCGRQDAGLSPTMTERLVVRISFCVVDNKALNPL